MALALLRSGHLCEVHDSECLLMCFVFVISIYFVWYVSVSHT